MPACVRGAAPGHELLSPLLLSLRGVLALSLGTKRLRELEVLSLLINSFLEFPSLSLP